MSVYAIIRNSYYDVLRIESIAYNKAMVLPGPREVWGEDVPGSKVYRTRRRAKSVLRNSGVSLDEYKVYEVDADFDKHATPIDDSPTDGRLKRARQILGEV